jgi:type IV secretory pathway VirB4 component
MDELAHIVAGGCSALLRHDFVANPETTVPYYEKLDRTTRLFFQTQFSNRTFDETRQQILTRLWIILSNGILERMFSSEKNAINLFSAMNSGSLILINTAKDLLKQDGCELLGRFFIALIAQATQERAVIPPEKRRATFVYIDEAHDYFDESLSDMLNQARKFKVGLVFAHQNLDQLDASLRATVMSSTSITPSAPMVIAMPAAIATTSRRPGSRMSLASA